VDVLGVRGDPGLQPSLLRGRERSLGGRQLPGELGAVPFEFGDLLAGGRPLRLCS
jgi:hypothetical protein